MVVLSQNGRICNVVKQIRLGFRMVRMDKSLCPLLVLNGRLVFIVVLIILVVQCHGLYAVTVQVPEDQPTIQAGIKATVDGDIVLVASGTYTGTGNVNLDFEGGKMTSLVGHSGSGKSTILNLIMLKLLRRINKN